MLYNRHLTNIPTKCLLRQGKQMTLGFDERFYPVKNQYKYKYRYGLYIDSNSI